MKIGAFSEELDSFPDFELPSQIQTLEIEGWPKLKSLPQQQIQHCTCLQVVSIVSFDSVEALPEWLGNLTSLTTLSIRRCKNLVSLPAVEVMQRLTKLKKLVIDTCPRLGGISTLKSGPEWHKISHIPRIDGQVFISIFHLPHSHRLILFQRGWGCICYRSLHEESWDNIDTGHYVLVASGS
ncbi:hypothetical protein L3X38_004970 [Prunus dulcis]|uniref:R13L1/DRL21-like LRR repeat region domain-containing protein n=1 Tax=Prunus dulcis TaxID=3755 RepID=A0AAD4ZQ13_PRUDU|nr:hypothetical protein L3X38_004970 [Prunus dulcis]